MRTVVTGATGFVGRYVVRELRARDHQVAAMVRPSSVVPDEFAQPGIELVRSDLRAPGTELLDALSDADAVIHLAAGMQGSPRQRFDATVLATERLIAAMREVDWRGRLVHVSSFAVYGFNQLRAGSLIDESTPLEPHMERRDDYAWVKAWQERLVSELRRQGRTEVVIVRPGAIYGRERQFQHRLGRPIGSRALLLIGGRSVMPLNYVENTASLLAECTENPAAAGEVFNAVDPEPMRQYGYLRRWRRAQEEPVRVIPLPLTVHRALGTGLELAGRISSGSISPPGMLTQYLTTPSLRSFRYKSSKATAVLGWEPPVSRAQALNRTFATSNGRSARHAEVVAQPAAGGG